MESGLASRLRDRHDLRSDVVLADLIERRGRVRVRCQSTVGPIECEGVITGATDEHLTVEFPSSNSRHMAWQVALPLKVVFETNGTCYTFTAACVGVESVAGCSVVRVRRPEGVESVDRRRSPRRGLREPVRIRIRAEQAGKTVDEWFSLLNLSADGMACRIPSHAVGVGVGDVVRVSFSLAQPDAEFDLRARVINVTRGATADQSILGLEFVSDHKLQTDRDRLVVALAGTRPK